MTRSMFFALLLSILIHALVAVGLIACFECVSQPDVLATLDLSSVELSFAEQVEETAAVAPAPAAAERSVPRPPQDERPPEAKVEKPLPPDPAMPKLREPPLSPPQFAQPPQLSAPAPRQAKVDAPPRPKRSIKPDYPRGARQRGEQGDVVLEIRVNAQGGVDDVKVAVSSGFAELDEAAVRAAKAARFSPARSGREPVASTARLKLQFKLK